MKDPTRPSSPGGEYAVGYGRPPEHTRFQPSRSGNPKGRAKGSKNLSMLFSEELAQTVTLAYFLILKIIVIAASGFCSTISRITV